MRRSDPQKATDRKGWEGGESRETESGYEVLSKSLGVYAFKLKKPYPQEEDTVNFFKRKRNCDEARSLARKLHHSLSSQETGLGTVLF